VPTSSRTGGGDENLETLDHLAALIVPPSLAEHVCDVMQRLHGVTIHRDHHHHRNREQLPALPTFVDD
jgi:hypothetical protein